MWLALGIAAFGASAAALIWAGARPPARTMTLAAGAPSGVGARARIAPSRYPAYGWWALAAMAVLELLLALRVAGIDTYFTALIWTAFIPAVDAAVFRRRGRSMLHEPARFAALCLLSIPIWLVFEAYNLLLRNWQYVGIPREFWWFLLGGSWAFATILPGIFEVADLLLAAGLEQVRSAPARLSPRWQIAASLVGAACLALPLIMPSRLAPYFFGLVWVGFVLLLEPINRQLRLPSLVDDLALGLPGRTIALLASGAICGFCWEFWNYWATARWEYIFPIFQHFKVFAMPLPGFLGFPPFALECFAMTGLLSWLALPEPLRPTLPEVGRR